MTIDVIAYEPHFVDHTAPVWLALPARLRGRFLTDPDLVPRARRLGVTDVLSIAAPRPRPAMPAPRFDGPPALVSSYGDLKKARRMGYGPFVFLEHGIGQSYAGDRAAASHASYSGGDDRDDVGLYLVPGPDPAARWRARYPEARVETIGCPKLDTLPAREPGPGPVVAISFHFPCSVTPETRPTIGHFAPAFAALRERFTLIGHAHPRLYSAERDYRRARVEYVPDFADVCRRADVYVCDNSSTLYEFAATGRPVVVLNGPGYRRHVTHGLRFWQAADVGIQVDDPRDLPDAIAEALEDAPERKAARERALDMVYAHRSGAAKRAAAAIASWMESRVEVAA